MHGSGFVISGHACARWIERVDPSATPAEALAAIRGHSRAIECALSLGCTCVRIGCGARIVLDLDRRQVVTVYPPQPKIHSLQRSRRMSFGAVRGCKREQWK